MNRDRLLSGDSTWLSDEHFTVDGTQLEAWASLKSFRCVDAAESDPPEDPGNPTVNFHGERRRNDTHQSTRHRRCRPPATCDTPPGHQVGGVRGRPSASGY